MTAIGIAIFWLGYTAFAYGYALDHDASVTFSDMVLPSHRQYAISQIKNPPNPAGSQPGLLDQILGGNAVSAGQAVGSAVKSSPTAGGGSLGGLLGIP